MIGYVGMFGCVRFRKLFSLKKKFYIYVYICERLRVLGENSRLLAFLTRTTYNTGKVFSMSYW